jgi:hypothetical protein
METLKYKRKRRGRCYELAATAMLDEPEADHWKLVHGAVWAHILVQYMDHAWIALPDGRVYDPVFHEYFEAQRYAERYHAIPAHKYSREGMVAHMNRTGHYGSWHDVSEIRRGGR